jgi:hypothetical protein
MLRAAKIHFVRRQSKRGYQSAITFQFSLHEKAILLRDFITLFSWNKWAGNYFLAWVLLQGIGSAPQQLIDFTFRAEETYPGAQSLLLCERPG